MQTTNTRKNSALQQGLIFGIALGILDIILNAISTFGNLGSAGIIISIVGIIAGILAYLFAGLRAAQVTGRTGTGALAGLFTGLFAGILSAIGTIIFTLINVDTLRQNAQATADKLHLSVSVHYTNATIISGAIVGVIVSLVLALALGAGIGAIGGLIGKSRARKEDAPVYQDTYTGPPTSVI